MRDVGIALRIEDVVVDSIQDSVQLVRVAAQQLIQAFAVLRRLNLLCVSLADRVHDVGEVDASTQHVDDVVESRNAEPDQTPFLQSREH